MKVRYVFPFILLLVALPGLSQTTAAGKASIVGVWRAQADGLPFITLTFTEEGGKLEGAVLFYLHKRESGGQVTSSPGVPEPLFDLHFDGKRATFAVSHRRAHPPASQSTPPVHFDMDVTDATHASLVNESEGGSRLSELGSGLPLVKSDY
jgi:hypothetical protein